MAKDRATLEKEIVDEIRGIKHGGMLGGMWFASFREDYYEKYLDLSEKKIATEILLMFLDSDNYDVGFRVKAAWICDDIGIPEAEEKIRKLSIDRDVINSTYSTGIKAVLNHMEIEKKLLNEIDQIPDQSDRPMRIAVYNKAIVAFRMLRGNLSQTYASKELYEKTEDELSRTVVSDILRKLMRSDRCDIAIKGKISLMLSDINIR